ncbi:glycoside hydrolase family 97 protein [Flavobacteriales bacterium]|nr:glycoside hydrolase family 97 protein [Flavobacteriales bacterium]
MIKDFFKLNSTNSANLNDDYNQKNNFSIIYLLLIFILVSCTNTSNKILTSPDNKIELSFEIIDGEAFYSINKDDKSVIKKSKLGILLENKLNIGKNLEIIKVSTSSNNSSWSPDFGEFDEIIDNYKNLDVSLSNGEINFNIVFRVYNDGVAFKYHVPNQSGITNYNVIDEYSEFNLNSDDTAWWIPGFSYRRYEFLYAESAIDKISKKFFSENIEDISYDTLGIDAAHTPLTIKKTNGLHVSIHEAKLINYSSMTLAPKGDGKLEVELYPWSDGITKVKLEKEIISPWRYIQIADNSSELLMSNLILNLNDDPDENKDFSWVKPGKYMGVWWEMIGTNESTWWESKYHGAKTEKVKNYLDFASKHNFDGLLVEGWNKGWYPEWCCRGEGIPFSFTETFDDFDIDFLSNYGLERNISLIGHHETGGQIQSYENQMEDAFKMYNKYGIKNIKTGYVNDVSKNIKIFDENGEISKEWHHGQYMVNHFQKVIDVAAKYELMIKTHEPIKDTGLRRTFPNFISREGAKGQEFNGFSSNGVNHATDLPFTRLLSGPMDYTPGVFQLNNFRYTEPGSGIIDKDAIIPSTIAKELALYVVYYSPMQMAADLPRHYKKHPEAFEFIKAVPVDWSDKVVLNSEISQYVTIARKDKNSENWFVGGITDENDRTFELDLSFLDVDHIYKFKIFKDKTNTHWKENPMEYEIDQFDLKIKNDSSTEIYIAPGGGFAMQIEKI